MKSLKFKNFRYLYESPVVLSWGSLTVRFLSFVLVWPIVLRTFSPAEIAVWGVISTLMGLQPILESAFSDTFSRIIAHARGGRSDFSCRGLEKVRNSQSPSGEPEVNWDAIAKVRSSMLKIYISLAGIFLVAAAILAPLVLKRPIDSIADPNLRMQAWIATGIACLVSAIGLFGNQYSAIANGFHWLKLLKRMEFLCAFGGLTTSLIVVLCGGRILGLVVANQVWVFISTVGLGFLVHRNFPVKKVIQSAMNSALMKQIWPGLWRSWLGIAISTGVMQAMPLIYAQDPDIKSVAEFLFAFRLMSFLVSLSLPPFYTKLTAIASLIAAHREKEAIELSCRRMSYSLWSFAIGFTFVGIATPFALTILKSKIAFVPPTLWWLFGLGFFLERMSGMHSQLFSQTGVILWHIGNSIYGLLFLVCALLLYSSFGPKAIGLGMIIANVLFFFPFSARQSYRRFGLNLWNFELKASGAPLILMLLYWPIVQILSAL